MTLANVLRNAAAGATLALAASVGVAHAQDLAIDDALAAEIQQDILLLPSYGEGTAQDIGVQAEDGRLVVTGIVDNNQMFEEIQALLQDRDGLDMDAVDNNIVLQ